MKYLYPHPKTWAEFKANRDLYDSLSFFRKLVTPAPPEPYGGY